MARTVKDSTTRRNEILDAAQRLIYTKGYELMTIQDILDELHISKGAFYHYFDSKVGLLEALAERIQQELEQLLTPIMQDTSMPALAKLERCMDVAGSWKTARKEYLLALLPTWYNDNNAIVRYKVQKTTIEMMSPLFTEIICDGIREGVLNTPYPEQMGGVLMALLQGFGEAFAGQLLKHATDEKGQKQLEMLTVTYTSAIERVLGIPSGSLRLIDEATLKEWMIPSA
jgi:AcrR family transcriptional regulator